MKRALLVLFLFFSVAISYAEVVILYNDNGNGGIHKSAGRIVIDEGQYYVDINNQYDKEHLKVYRVWDNADDLYNQPKWAEKYNYVVYRGNGYIKSPLFFNMKSEWIPSLTEDPDDPSRIIPIKKITAYSGWSNVENTIKVVLIKKIDNYYLYHGDPFFCATVDINNDDAVRDRGSWAKGYQYCAEISGIKYFFNI